MINNNDCNTETNCEKSRVCWSAVFAGAIVAIGLSFLLNLFSMAISLSFVSTTKEGLATLAIGGFIGMAIGIVAAMFAAGFTAGYLGQKHCTKRNLGCLYGFCAWCLALILTVLLATNMSRYVNFYTDFSRNPTMVVDTSVSRTQINAPTTKVNRSAVVSTNNATVMDVKTQNAVNNLGTTSLLIFVLFALGALASALGGHCGMNHCCRTECTRKDNVINR